MSDNENMHYIQRSQVVEMDAQKARNLTPDENANATIQINESIKEDDESLIQQLKLYKPKSKQFTYEILSQLINFNVKQSKDRIHFGSFFNKVRQGRGVSLYTNGRVYEGHWENDRKHGYGFETFASGAVYVGYYANNKPHGVGKYVWGNGEIYEGEWVNGTKHGNGMWVGIKQDKYVGEWQNGKPHGQGIHSWVNGDRYEGEFSECLKQGYGSEKFGNGDFYEGYYSNGKPDGKGKYKWLDGSTFKGTFENGLRCGEGEYFCTKYQYKGSYMNDRKSGYGEFIYPDGRIYRGNFFDDLKQGEGVLYQQDGSMVQQKWLNGQLVNENQQDPLSQTSQQQQKQSTSQKQLNIFRLTKPKIQFKKKNIMQKGSVSSQDMFIKTQNQKLFVRSDSPKQQSKISQFCKPPSSQKSNQSYRTTRQRSDLRSQPKPTEDFFLQTIQIQNVHKPTNSSHTSQNWPQIPFSKRPNLSNPIRREKSKTPDFQQKKENSSEKPQFNLRFDPIDKLNFKTHTGLKGIKKCLNLSSTQQNDVISRSKIPELKVVVRLRSISNTVSGTIVLFQ